MNFAQARQHRGFLLLVRRVATEMGIAPNIYRLVNAVFVFQPVAQVIRLIDSEGGLEESIAI